jgi:hypothetical protein
MARLGWRWWWAVYAGVGDWPPLGLRRVAQPEEPPPPDWERRSVLEPAELQGPAQGLRARHASGQSAARPVGGIVQQPAVRQPAMLLVGRRGQRHRYR